MSFSLEMLTKAADLVETQEKQKRLLESPNPLSETRKPSSNISETNSEDIGRNGTKERTINGTGENHHQGHMLQNGRLHDNTKHSPGTGSNLTKTVNNHDRHASEDELRNRTENSQQVVADPSSIPESAQYLLYQQRLAERANGIDSQKVDLKHRPSDERPRTLHSPERYHPAERRSTSPVTDRGGETNASTKPMVLLQPPTAANFSSVGSTHPAQLSNPVLHAAAATMHHHPYMYSMMYPTGVPLDPALGGAFARVPGAGLKEGEGPTSSPNASPNASLSAATAAGMHFPAGLMYPLAANQALLMGTRAPGSISDISPLLLAQPSAAYPGHAGVAPNFLMEYKRLLEGLQFPAATYPIQSQFSEQYIRALMGQGIDCSKEALALSAIPGRLPQGMPLAALQGQPGVTELMRYQEQLNSAMGILRPQDGMSPRAASPYASKRRTESPVLPNGNKIATSSYPYHVASLAQPTINNLSYARPHARSPASVFSQGHRSRSPQSETRKPEPERSVYRNHSRDLDREVNNATKDLASTSASINQSRNSSEHVAHSYSVTDVTGRKIQLPAFYSGGASVHVPHGYPVGMAVHHPGDERSSPSPHSRASDERSYHRPSRERSPGGDHLPNKRRSLDTQYRHSPALNDRHHSRPESPTTNGQIPAVRHSLVNGSVEVAAELDKVRSHLMRPIGHVGTPNQSGLAEGREQGSSSPATTNPYHLPPYLAPQFIMPHYAQALAGAAKGSDLAALYKASENGADYSRLSRLPFGMALLPQPQQHLLASGRSPHVLQQEYAAAALKTQSYLASQAAAKESGKSSPANIREKHHSLSQSIHPSLLTQEPSRALSPAKQGLKPKHSPSPQFSKSQHHQLMTDSHSPPGVSISSANASSDGRRYMSPRPERRDTSPKPVASNKPYRPNPMLRDLERSRKRKLLEEEIAMGEEASNFRQGKQQQLIQQRQDQREQLPKDAKKDPKRRKQLITDGDPDIEEHFRRSLGKDYKETSNKVSITGTVDDHFKKALGVGVWDKLQTPPSTTPIKAEQREVVVPHSSPALPSYSVAVAAGTVRGYPAYAESKEALRMYDPAYLASRERYHIQSMANQQRRTEKSPPRAPGSTVLYPPNPPPVGPAKQRVKAKAVFPEAASLGSDMNNRSARATSLGSKGSSRSVSGSSAESLPAALCKSPPTSSPISSSAAEGIPRVPSRGVLQNAIPFTFAQSAGLPTTIATHALPPVISVSGVTQQKPTSPISPRTGGVEEQSRSPPAQKCSAAPVSGTKEPTERQPVENGKPTT
ncbi:uncharacterized protein LOC120328107 [Styela clava]